MTDEQDFDDIAENDEIEDFIGQTVSATFDLSEAEVDVRPNGSVTIKIGPDGSYDGALNKVKFPAGWDRATANETMLTACKLAEEHRYGPEKFLGEYDFPLTVEGELAVDTDGDAYIKNATIDSFNQSPTFSIDYEREIVIHVDEVVKSKPDRKSDQISAYVIGTSEGRQITLAILNNLGGTAFEKKLSEITKTGPFKITGHFETVGNRTGLVAATTETRFRYCAIEPDDGRTRPTPRTENLHLSRESYMVPGEAAGRQFARLHDLNYRHPRILFASGIPIELIDNAGKNHLPDGSSRTAHADLATLRGHKICSLIAGKPVNQFVVTEVRDPHADKFLGKPQNPAISVPTKPAKAPITPAR